MQKIYPGDVLKIAANRATAGERERHNARVDEEKESKHWTNRRGFIPLKASHKQACVTQR